MLEQIINIDKIVFYFFNKVIANTLFDILMPIMTSIGISVFSGCTSLSNIKRRS